MFPELFDFFANVFVIKSQACTFFFNVFAVKLHKKSNNKAILKITGN
jgi:hypothetical protein